MLPSLALSLLAALLLGGLLALSLLLQDRLLELRHEVRRVEAYQSDARWTARAISSLSQVSRITETGVALGTEAVRGIHKGIASIPFNILEAIPVTRDTTRLVRAVHDQTSDAVYGSIKIINRVIGRNLRRGLGDDAPQRGPVADLVAFRHFIETRPDATEFRCAAGAAWRGPGPRAAHRQPALPGIAAGWADQRRRTALSCRAADKKRGATCVAPIEKARRGRGREGAASCRGTGKQAAQRLPAASAFFWWASTSIFSVTSSPTFGE